MTSKKTKEKKKSAKGGPIATEAEMDEYPELFAFFYDDLVDVRTRVRGVSPLSNHLYLKIKTRYENNEYPEHLRWLAEKELKLKIE